MKAEFRMKQGAKTLLLGEARLEDGQVVAEPPNFETWLRAQPGTDRFPLDPSTGEEYFRNLSGLFRMPYMYVTLIDESSGGAPTDSGGAERTT